MEKLVMNKTDIITFNDVPVELLPGGLTEQILSQMQAEAFALSVKDVSDTEGYNTCKEMRKTVRKLRTSIENRRKEAKADALAYGKKVDGEAKRLTAEVRKAEDYLKSQEQIVDDHKAKLKAEKEEQKRLMIEGRANALQKVNAVFSVTSLGDMSETEYQQLLSDAGATFLENKRRREQEAERLKQLEAERQQKEAELKAVHEKAEAQRLEQEKKHRAELAALQVEKPAIVPEVVAPAPTISEDSYPTRLNLTLVLDESDLFECIEHLNISQKWAEEFIQLGRFYKMILEIAPDGSTSIVQIVADSQILRPV